MSTVAGIGAQVNELQWRRIIWFQKGPLPIDPGSGQPVPISAVIKEHINPDDPNTNMFFRNIDQLTTNQSSAFFNHIFRGQSGTQNPTGPDWYDPMTAFKDTENIKFYSDKTMTFNPANQSVLSRQFKRWYPVNKLFVYNDQEQGGLQHTNIGAFDINQSTTSRRGCGDMYIMDIFRPYLGNAGNVNLTIEAELFWHEK